MASRSLCDILGVPETATFEEIKAAYRERIRRAHPDLGGSEEDAKVINAAFEVLSDPERRSAYDRSRRSVWVMRCPLCDELTASEDDLLRHFQLHREELRRALGAAVRHVSILIAVVLLASACQAFESPVAKINDCSLKLAPAILPLPRRRS